MRTNTVYEGDCLDIMRQLPDNSIDPIITDPPYELDFMGKHWDATGIAFNTTVWRECLRVAKPGATLMAFGGSRTHHRLACAIEDAGWEIRDCISYFSDGTQAEQAFMASLNEEQLAAYMDLHYPGYQMSWVYGQGIGLGHDVSKGIDKRAGKEREGSVRIWKGGQRSNGIMGNNKGTQTREIRDNPASPLAAKFSGWNSRLKPAFEPIILAMAPMGNSYAANAEKWGVAGLWIDGGRVPTNGETRTFSPTVKRRGGILNKTDEMRDHWETTKGRYPSNVIHSAELRVIAEFDKAGVSVSRASGYNTDRTVSNGSVKMLANYIKSGVHFSDTGTPARFFAHCPPDTSPARFVYCPKASSKERGAGNTHCTVKPLSLVRYLCRLTRTPDGGIVLDPFAGSGTTALACLSEGRDYILIEKEAAYVDICKRRIAEYTGQAVEEKEIVVNQETVKQMSLW